MDKKNQLTIISDSLKTLLETKASALPKGFNETRFLQNAMTVLNDTTGIEKCDARSVARTMLKGAFLGLDFFNRECYAIPYGGKLQFQTDYKGEIKLAKKYSINKIKDIYAKVVKKGDEFIVNIDDGRQRLSFTPKPFSDEDIIGAFAVAYFQDDTMMYDVMTTKEIDHTRTSYSKAPNSPAWKNSAGEMYKKTVLRRLCKMIELDFDTQEQKIAFDDSSDFDPKKDNKETIDVSVKDPFVEPAQIEAPKEDTFDKPQSEVKCDSEGRIIE